MKIRAWRVLKGKYEADPFSGKGASEFWGRWNSIGTRIVYTSESLSLATLEILAGGISISLLSRYVKIPIDFDSSLVESLALADLPKEWSHYPPSGKTQEIGDNWKKDFRSAILKVPSVVIKEEFNYLINPFHPNFKKLSVGKAVTLSFDARLISKP
jgi:RES domain-containing protein